MSRLRLLARANSPACAPARISSRVLAAVLLLVLTNCGTAPEEPDRTAGSPSSSSPAEAEPTAEPSAAITPSQTPEGLAPTETSPSTSAPEPGESRDAGATDGTATTQDSGSTEETGVRPAPGAPQPTGGRYGRLLNGNELPGFDADWSWSEFESIPREDGLFTLCQRFLFSDIGATQVVVRRFDAAVVGADGDNAGQLVATFPDEKQARQALSVLQAWAEDCEPDGSGVRANVSPWTKVQTADATAYWYAVRVKSSSPEEARTERVTVVQRSNRLAVVRTQLLGKERSYAPTQDPAARTAGPTASKLGV